MIKVLASTVCPILVAFLSQKKRQSFLGTNDTYNLSGGGIIKGSEKDEINEIKGSAVITILYFFWNNLLRFCND